METPARTRLSDFGLEDSVTQKGRNEAMTLTAQVHESLFRAVEAYAVKRDTSVDALIRDFLAEIGGREQRVRRALARIRELRKQSTARVGFRTWVREDLYGGRVPSRCDSRDG